MNGCKKWEWQKWEVQRDWSLKARGKYKTQSPATDTGRLAKESNRTLATWSAQSMKWKLTPKNMLSSFQMLVNVAVFHLLTQACILEILCNWQQRRLEERLKQMLQYWGPLTLCEVFKSSDPAWVQASLWSQAWFVPGSPSFNSFACACTKVNNYWSASFQLKFLSNLLSLFQFFGYFKFTSVECPQTSFISWHRMEYKRI